MLAKSVGLLLLCAAAGLAGGCSTPCDAPGRLCAPVSSITSAPPAPPARAQATPPPPADTFAVTMPGAGAAAAGAPPAAAPAPAAVPVPAPVPFRIAVLLPLRSETLGQAADAVRAGFMAAWAHEPDNMAVSVVDTGDVPQDVLASYASALEQQDMVVGPLARSAVGAVAASGLVQKPTIALNTPEGHGALPPQMLAMGLSIEEEARQAAQWAAAEQPHGNALILATSTPWQRRVANAFAAQWQRLGLPSRIVELGSLNGYLSDPELVQLRARIVAEQPDLLFSALGADQTRQLRAALSSTLADGSGPAAVAPPPLPIYGTSALNPGDSNNFPTQDLDGVRLLDLPWQLQRDHPAVMVYPHPASQEERKPGAADMERLYALGIDAYRVAREIARHPASRFQLDGVTGRLGVSFGLGEARFERVELPAIYKNGVPLPLPQPNPP